MKNFRHLTKTDVLQVCSIIENWPLPTLTWDALCREVELNLGHRYTRQSLEKKTEIKIRFQARRANPKKAVISDETERTIDRLRARVAQLEKALAEYDLRFLRHIDKAIQWNKSPQDLEAPLLAEVPTLRKQL